MRSGEIRRNDGAHEESGLACAPHLLHVFSSFSPGGCELRTVQLIENLGQRFRHTILALDGRTEAASRLSPGAPVELLEGKPAGSSLAKFLLMRRACRAVAPDLVLTYNWGSFDALLAALLSRLPTIHHEDGFNADEAIRFKRRRVWARRIGLRGVQRLVVPSERLQGIAKRLWRVREERLELIPNGISTSEFSPGGRRWEVRQQLGIPSSSLVIGTVGQLRPVKNIARLIEAVAGLTELRSDFHLLIVGDGVERRELELHAGRLGLSNRAHFVGYQPQTSGYLQAMDLYALSSDSEQMPISLLEAMASGLPVVATDVGDVRSMLPDEQGPYLVSLARGSPTRGLTGCLRSLLESESDRIRLGRENRRTVEERYDLQRMCRRYEQIYASCLGERGLGESSQR